MEKPFLGLRTCIYVVPDLDAAKTWYTQIFETAPYFDQPFYVGFEIAGYELGLMPEEGEVGKKTSNVHTYWGVTDIESSYQRLLKLGATADGTPQDVGDNVWVATVKDPWDNLLGIIQNPYFKL